MNLPYIIILDDDRQVLGAIHRDVRNKYRDDYRVVASDNPMEVLQLIAELKLKNESVALFISDQKMPGMEGVEFLSKAKETFPDAKRVLLTAYSDIQAAVKAINNVKLHYYLPKPWSPPEEKLFPIMNDLLDEWQANYKPDHEGIRIIGFQWSPKSHRLKEFLSGNLIPYQWVDAEINTEASKYIQSANTDLSRLPLVILKDGKALIDPTLQDVANNIGLKQKAQEKIYDVVIIGAGPAGLAASLYGSCEGLDVLLIEKNNPGGQASTSSLIENYLGFPAGLSGAELTRRAIAQTTRFGTEILTPQEVKSVTLQDGYKKIIFADDTYAFGKSVVISTGIAFKQLDVPGIEKFTGSGVYYGAAPVEAHACKNEIICISGGGNSACQAAMYLCKFAKEVNIVIRKEKLSQTAADYLVHNISEEPNIKIIGNTEVTEVYGDKVLEKIKIKNMSTGEESIISTKALFVYIGAKPETQWIDSVLKDDKGFILSGKDLLKEKSFASLWKLQREPYITEASIPGVFASGDVRSGALTGISAAVGEGALAIRFVRKYLQEG